MWQDNWRSWLFFLTVQTQWVINIIAGMNSAKVVYVGLDYKAIESAMNMISIKKKHRPRIFDDLRLIESVVLKIRNKQQ